MKIVHSWEVPDLRVLELEEKFRILLIGRLLKRFKKIIEIVEHYDKLLSYNIHTMKSFIKKLFHPDFDYSIPIDILVKITEDNNISKYKLEKALIKVKGSKIGKPFKPGYPLKINNIRSILKEDKKLHSWEIKNLQAKRLNKGFSRKLKDIIILRFGTIENAVI